MQTVSFQCSHCNNLMAVETELVGRQVRCPHCQQVVTVPGADAPAPGAPVSAAVGENERPLAPPEPAGDHPSDTPAELPAVEMPQPSWLNAQTESPPATAAAGQPLEGQEAEAAAPVPHDSFFGAAGADAEPTATFGEPAPSGTDAGFSPRPGDQDAPPAAGEWSAADDGAAVAEGATDFAPAGPAAGRRPQPRGLGLILVLIFLLPYAIFATATAVYFYLQLRKVPNPFEALPDWPGDKPGATRKGQGSIMLERLQPDAALPPKLRVPLHQALTVGDLQVTPERVQQRRLALCYEHSDRKPVPLGEALVLTLHLRNVSRDDHFVPTDAAFYRKWTDDEPATQKPYTFLEVGAKRFYGGPIDWQFRLRRNDPRRQEDARVYIQGQENYQEVLQPGRDRRVQICTDDNPELLRAVRGYGGQLMWRVQLRRGLVQARDREVSASAVIGVEFTCDEID